MTLYMSVNGTDNYLPIYQNTLDQVANWSSTWELQIPLTKCCKLDIGHPFVNTGELKLYDATSDCQGLMRPRHLQWSTSIV